MNSKYLKSKTNHRGQMGFDIMIKLLIVFLAVTTFVALIPSLADTMDDGLEALNCVGTATYNSTLGERSSVGCLGLKLYIPYIVLVVLIALVARLFYNNVGSAPQYGGG